MNNFMHKSKWSKVVETENGKEIRWLSKTYVRPKREGEIKGKLNIKFAKKQKVKAMKARQAAEAAKSI